MTADRIAFAKGHGTGNDFVILTDLENALDLTPRLVAALCDRRQGIGGDGVLVVARTSSHEEVADQAGVAPYFMDYRNADGSIAQMCGNGARVFVAHLLATGLAGPGSFHIATRGGARRVSVTDRTGPVVVDMGPPAFVDDDSIRVVPAGLGGARADGPAVGVLMPNPHAVTWVDDLAQAGPLLQAPLVTPASVFPEGVNVEFVQQLGDNHLAMRVYERGVGETLSCGTGACAAAVAAIRRDGSGPGGPATRVDVPGGELSVRWRGDGNVELGGPVELVATGWIAPGWWQRHA